MLRNSLTPVGKIWFLTMLVVPRAAAADQHVGAEIQHLSAVPISSGDRDISMYKTTFDLRLINRTAGPMVIPQAETASGDATRIVVIGVQHKRSDGSWTYVTQSSWYGDRDTKYAECTTLTTSEAGVIGGLVSGLTLMKQQAVELGSQPILRFDLLMMCKQPHGEVVSKTVKTEEFVANLSGRQ